MRLRNELLVVPICLLLANIGHAHELYYEHAHLFTDPEYGSANYLTAINAALEKLPNDPKTYITLRHEVARINWPVITDIFNGSEDNGGPYYLNFFGQFECNIPAFARASVDPIELFNGKCDEYFGNARVRLLLKPYKNWMSVTFRLLSKTISAVPIDDEYVVIYELKQMFKQHGDDTPRRKEPQED